LRPAPRRQTLVFLPVLCWVFGSEGQPQSEFNLPGRSQAVDTCPNADAVHIVIGACGAIDLARASRQQPIQGAAGKIIIGEVEEIVESHTGLDGQALKKRMTPRELEVECPQPGHIDLSRWCIRNGGGDRAQGNQLRLGKEVVLDQHLSRWGRLPGISAVVAVDGCIDVTGIDAAHETADGRAWDWILGCAIAGEIGAEDFTVARRSRRHNQGGRKRAPEMQDRAQLEANGQVGKRSQLELVRAIQHGRPKVLVHAALVERLADEILV